MREMLMCTQRLYAVHTSEGIGVHFSLKPFMLFSTNAIG
jgi:hypothetical protein